MQHNSRMGLLAKELMQHSAPDRDEEDEPNPKRVRVDVSSSPVPAPLPPPPPVTEEQKLANARAVLHHNSAPAPSDEDVENAQKVIARRHAKKPSKEEVDEATAVVSQHESLAQSAQLIAYTSTAFRIFAQYKEEAPKVHDPLDKTCLDMLLAKRSSLRSAHRWSHRIFGLHKSACVCVHTSKMKFDESDICSLLGCISTAHSNAEFVICLLDANGVPNVFGTDAANTIRLESGSDAIQLCRAHAQELTRLVRERRERLGVGSDTKIGRLHRELAFTHLSYLTELPRELLTVISAYYA